MFCENSTSSFILIYFILFWNNSVELNNTFLNFGHFQLFNLQITLNNLYNISDSCFFLMNTHSYI